jgi:hypothetical protein
MSSELKLGPRAEDWIERADAPTGLDVCSRDQSLDEAA